METYAGAILRLGIFKKGQRVKAVVDICEGVGLRKGEEAVIESRSFLGEWTYLIIKNGHQVWCRERELKSVN